MQMINGYGTIRKDWINPLIQFKGGAEVNIKIDKNNRIPLYIQVKKQIIYLIKNGSLRVGTKMPTERELAKVLGISRNTISSAYNELEAKGVLKSIRGRGTFVAEEVSSWKTDEGAHKVYKLVDIALEEALECGIESEDFLDLVISRVREKSKAINRIVSGFVECNNEQAVIFSKEIHNITRVNTIPFTLKQLKDMDEETRSRLNQCHIIIAPFNHANEVNELLQGLDKEVFGVATGPNLESIVRIARHPMGTKFSFVCLSEEFIFRIESALDKAGIGDLEVKYFNGRDEEKLKETIDFADVLIVTPARYSEVTKLNIDNKELIEFSYIIDSESIKMLKSKIIETKCQND